MSAQEISNIFRRYVELGTLVADLVEGKSAKSEMLVKIISSDMDRLVMLLKEPAEKPNHPIAATPNQAAPAVEPSACVDLSLLNNNPQTHLGAVSALQNVPFHQIDSGPNTSVFNPSSTLAMQPASTYFADYGLHQFQPQADPFMGYLQGFNPNQPFQHAQPVASSSSMQRPASHTRSQDVAGGSAQSVTLPTKPSGVGPVKEKKERRQGGFSKKLRCDCEDDDGNECGILFYNKNYLEQHKQKGHYDADPTQYLVCAHCNHGFISEATLHNHAQKCPGGD